MDRFGSTRGQSGNVVEAEEETPSSKAHEGSSGPRATNLDGLRGCAEFLGFNSPIAQYRAQVSEGLARGSRLNEPGIARLKNHGFKSIVNLCEENDFDSSCANKIGLHALRIPVKNTSSPTESQILEFLKFVTNPNNQPAYVHCEAGQGRTGVAVACYRMAIEGWSAERALEEAIAFGLSIPIQEDFIMEFGYSLANGRIPEFPMHKKR